MVIENAYIWDNTVVGDNCRISTCVVGFDVVVKANVSIEAGTLIEGKVFYHVCRVRYVGQMSDGLLRS